jgi:hypothetical protein
MGEVREPLGGVVEKVVTVVVGLLRFRSKLQLILPHSFELVLGVVKDVVPPRFAFTQKQQCALIDAVRDAVTGNVGFDASYAHCGGKHV